MMEREVKIHELPSYPNPFIGRTHHIHFIRSLLQEADKRLITLLGPGGMGKTRLSVRIGEIMSESFTHGVCFVALDAVSDPKQVPLYIGQHLGLKAYFNGDWIETIIDFLREKNLLLILDNLEQILDAARDIDRILECCPDVKVLVTSREILGLPREIEYPLDSLNRPNARLFPDPADLIKFDAIDLFVQKAKASRPDFQLDKNNAVEVVRICQELEGLPLPIELAAARIKLFSPKIILEKLSSQTDLLKTQSRGVILRHQNIRNTIQWSYDLLDEQEQEHFRQLSLFPGGFTVEAVAATCPGVDALEVIESFINKSLVVKGKEVYGTPRFRMLKLIRDFGWERLQEQASSGRYYKRFADYFVNFLETGFNRIRMTDPARWTALTETEYENLVVALNWLTEHAPRQAARLGTIFWRFHLSRGFLQEGLDIVERLLPLAGGEQNTEAKLLEGAGSLSHNLGHHLAARDYFSRCLELWEKIQDQKEVVKALNNLAWAAWRIGNYDQTVFHSEKALELSQMLHDLPGQAKSLNNLAWIHFYRGRFDRAEALQQQVLAIYLQLDDQFGNAFAKTNLSLAMIKTGKFLEAELILNDAIELFDQLKNQQLRTFARAIKAIFHAEKEDFTKAKQLLLEQCLPNFEKIGDLWGIVYCLNQLGRIHFMEEDLETAKQEFARSVLLSRQSHDKYGEAVSSLWWSKICRVSKDQIAAKTALERTLSLAAEMKAHDLLIDSVVELAHYALQRDDHIGALHRLAVADHLAETLGPFPYQRFRTSILFLSTALRDWFASHRVDLKAAFLEKPASWHPDFLPGPIAVEELLFRSQDILKAPPASEKEDTHRVRVEEASPAAAESPFLRQARQVVEAQLQDPDFSVQMLAREMRMSHSQLHRKLRAQTGLSTSHFIRNIRLDKARELLKDPELTIMAIACDTGFRDTDYFYRVFKRETGMTPGDFRKASSAAAD